MIWVTSLSPSPRHDFAVDSYQALQCNALCLSSCFLPRPSRALLLAPPCFRLRSPILSLSWISLALWPHTCAPRRVAIAGALAQRPMVLLLDELTTFLDGEDQGAVLAAVRALTRPGAGVTALWVRSRCHSAVLRRTFFPQRKAGKGSGLKLCRGLHNRPDTSFSVKDVEYGRPAWGIFATSPFCMLHR